MIDVFADHDARAVIQEETLADLGTRVNVDAGQPVAYSEMMRGTIGTRSLYSTCAIR